MDNYKIQQQIEKLCEAMEKNIYKTIKKAGSNRSLSIALNENENYISLIMHRAKNTKPENKIKMLFSVIEKIEKNGEFT
jgi:UDP-N-acetylglucosamine 2-epimerase